MNYQHVANILGEDIETIIKHENLLTPFLTEIIEGNVNTIKIAEILLVYVKHPFVISMVKNSQSLGNRQLLINIVETFGSMKKTIVFLENSLKILKDHDNVSTLY